MAGNPFSDTYTEARTRFLAAAEAAGGQVQSHENRNARGPEGESLFLDAAWFGDPRAGSVLLNTSGTHGAEGFVGSAAQLAWIGDGGPRMLDPDTAVLMVHAVNPFGFAHCLRCTEDNVDVNRNWLDFSAELPRNPLYRELHQALCVHRIDDQSLAAAAHVVSTLAEVHGQWTVDDALSRGQYEFADGYYYGGAASCWSRRMLAAIVARELAWARRVGVIDWHSGPIGDGELIYLCYDERDSQAFERAASWWGRDNLDSREVDRLWGGRRPTRHGIMVSGIGRLLGQRTRMAGGVIELCSAPHPKGPAGAFRVPMIERWLRFVGGLDTMEAARYREELRDNYAPRRKSWEQSVIASTLEVYRETVAGLALWAAE